jgi:hypothetical protein
VLETARRIREKVRHSRRARFNESQNGRDEIGRRQ